MKIAVVGSKRGLGSSTLALMLSLWLSQKYNKKVNFLASDNYYKNALGIVSNNSIFQDIKNIYSLLKSDKLDFDTISSFSDSNIKRLDIFPFKSEELSEVENEEIQKFILNKLSYDYTILDLKSDDTALSISLKQIDLCIIVASQEQESIFNTGKIANLVSDSIMLVINKYNKEISTKMAIRGSFFSNKEKWQKRAKFINYEPLIVKFGNYGELYKLVAIMKDERQPLFIDISNSLDDIVNTIFMQNGDEIVLEGDENE